MSHTHGMDPIRHEAEREAAERIYNVATALLNHGDELLVIRTSHTESFPCGALTCEQVDRLLIGISHIERARLTLKELSKELPNRARKEATR